MGKRMGRALLAAIKKEPGPAPAPKEGVLGNPQRRRVLQYFCLHPCGALGEAAKALGLSPGTVRFHALRLASSEYLAPAASSFFPADLVPREDVPLFAALASAATRRVLAAVYANTGLTIGELAEALEISRQGLASLLETFESLGLVTKVADGRSTRVYPTRALEGRRDANRGRRRQFCDTLARRLEAEGESPQVLRRTDTEIQLRFGRGSAKATLELSVEPYSAVLV